MSKKKGKPPAFQFYTDDWLGSTTLELMSDSEKVAYLRLLCHQWNNEECTLPADDASLARLSRLGKRWAKSASKILERFPICPEDESRRANSKLSQQKRELERIRHECSVGGIRGNLSRWNNSSQVSPPVSPPESPPESPPVSGLGRSSSSSSSSSSTSEVLIPKDSLTFVEKVKPKAVKASTIKLEDIEFPLHLDTETGRAALADWLDYKRERRESYKNTRGLTALFGLFKDLTDRDFQQAIQASIASNYAGVFPPRATQAPMFKTQDRPLTTAQKTQEVLNRRLQKLRGNHDRSTDDSIIDVSGEVLE